MYTLYLPNLNSLATARGTLILYYSTCSLLQHGQCYFQHIQVLLLPPCLPIGASTPYFLSLLASWRRGNQTSAVPPASSGSLWLPSSKLISLKGEMRPPCVAGAAPTGEEVRNETSTPCAIICRSAFLVYAALRSGAQFYAAVRSGVQWAVVRSCAHLCSVVRSCAQPIRIGCAAIAQWMRSGAQWCAVIAHHNLIVTHS
jgi:hypothetical protein